MEKLIKTGDKLLEFNKTIWASTDSETGRNIIDKYDNREAILRYYSNASTEVIDSQPAPLAFIMLVGEILDNIFMNGRHSRDWIALHDYMCFGDRQPNLKKSSVLRNVFVRVAKDYKMVMEEPWD